MSSKELAGANKQRPSSTETMTQSSAPAAQPLLKAPLSSSQARQPAQAPQPVIKKPQALPRRRQSDSIISNGKQALELENRLESSLAVAAGGITTLTKNIMARQTNPELMKGRQLTFYISRLRVVSEELKSQLQNMGNCSKLSNQQDHKPFDPSYQGILALWREYQRVGGCVIQHSRVRRQSRKEGASAETDNSSGSTALSSSPVEAVTRVVDDARKQ